MVHGLNADTNSAWLNNDLLDNNSVYETDYDREMAKAFGIVYADESYYTNPSVSYEEAKSDVPIEHLLNLARTRRGNIENKKANIGSDKVNSNGSEAVSRTSYKYKDMDGTLIKYEDGSFLFTNVTAEHTKENFRAVFKNEEDLKAGRPAQTTIKQIKESSLRGGKSPEFEQLITNFEYNPNGSLKSKETKDDKGVIRFKLENDDMGNLVLAKKFNSEGTLVSTREASFIDENQKVILLKNGKGEVMQKTVIMYENNKPVTSTIYNKDGIILSERKYYDNGKVSYVKIYHEDGKTVKEEIEFFSDSKGLKYKKIYNADGELKHEYIADMVPDGKSWNKDSQQSDSGDCYLLASINAIRELENGDKILSDLIDIKTDESGKKTYTVTLPGAKIAAESLRRDGLKVSISGTYTFTEEEFAKIAKLQGAKYSLGNANIILLEAAFEQYRQEVNKTAKDNNIKKEDIALGIAGLEGLSGTLDGGLTFDAVFVMTGKNSKTYLVTSTGRGLDMSALSRGEAVVVSKNRPDVVAAGVSSIDGELTTDQEKMNKMLDTIMNDMRDGKKDVIATACFRIYRDGKERGGHAFTIKDVTEDTVTIINPWFPDETITMSRSEFVKSATCVTITDTSKETVLNEKKIEKRNTKPKGNKNTTKQPPQQNKKSSVNNIVKKLWQK